MVLVSGAAIVFAGAIIAVAMSGGGANDEELLSPPAVYQADRIAGETLGSQTAPVLIELYSDFQCPACKLFVTEELHRLYAEFVAPGTVRIEARDIAFLGTGSRDESLELAVGARCAGEQNRYWAFHDFVFWNQGRENRGDHSEAFVDRVAAATFLDADAFEACVARPDVRASITQQTSTALAAGIQSTPTLMVNGQAVVGVPPYDQLATLIRSLAAAPSPTPGP